MGRPVSVLRTMGSAGRVLRLLGTRGGALRSRRPVATSRRAWARRGSDSDDATVAERHRRGRHTIVRFFRTRPAWPSTGSSKVSRRRAHRPWLRLVCRRRRRVVCLYVSSHDVGNRACIQSRRIPELVALDNRRAPVTSAASYAQIPRHASAEPQCTCGGRSVTPARCKIFPTVDRATPTSAATCRVLQPSEYTSTIRAFCCLLIRCGTGRRTRTVGTGTVTGVLRVISLRTT